MDITVDPAQLKKTARIAGLLYLINGIAAGFGFSFSESLVVAGDIPATMQNIKENESLFRLALFSELFGQIIQIFLALILYDLFKSVHKTHARYMAALVLVAVPIAMLNQVNKYALLWIVNNAEFLKSHSPEQINSLVMFFRNLYEDGLQIATIFWGLWLVPLGTLTIKSKYMPKILGYLLIFSGFGYIINGGSWLLFPESHLKIAMYTFFGEVTFLLWLLIKGVSISSADDLSFFPDRVSR